jgi:hypothetical protein
MVARILVSMGGTVAEELVFGRDQVREGTATVTLIASPGSVSFAVPQPPLLAISPYVTCGH